MKNGLSAVFFLICWYVSTGENVLHWVVVNVISPAMENRVFTAGLVMVTIIQNAVLAQSFRNETDHGLRFLLHHPELIEVSSGAAMCCSCLLVLEFCALLTWSVGDGVWSLFTFVCKANIYSLHALLLAPRINRNTRVCHNKKIHFLYSELPPPLSP